MRYLVRSTLVALVGLALVTTQAKAQAGMELGVRGGVSVAQVSGDFADTFDKSNRTGFAGGVFLNFDWGILGAQVAGQYTQKGADLDIGNTVESLSLNYFEIPAVIKAGIPLGMIKPSVFGGVALGFNTSCDSSGEDCGDNVKSTEWLGVAGADVAIYVGSISLWVDGRYNFGLSDINDATDVVGDLKNRNWTFQGGVAFAL
ncbi:MAG: porin family protein [Candidatus Palauibacterales bacterium]|nr:porin family protein [Candidatus Palauibacterales bacterium]